MDFLPKELVIEIIQYLQKSKEILNFLDAYKNLSVVFDMILEDHTFKFLTKSEFPLIFEDIQKVIEDDEVSTQKNPWLHVYAHLKESFFNKTKITFEGIFKNEKLYGYEFKPTLPEILYRDRKSVV